MLTEVYEYADREFNQDSHCATGFNQLLGCDPYRLTAAQYTAYGERVLLY